MIKIKLFSAQHNTQIEGEEADLYITFFLILNKNYVFTFCVDSPNLTCSDRNPIRLWKHFLLLYEEEYIRYLRKYEKHSKSKERRIT